jgi:hypothetical protein
MEMEEEQKIILTGKQGSGLLIRGFS